MTLNQQNRTRLQRLCTELRAETWPTWDSAGTEAAILELDKRLPTDPLGVAVRALLAARNPANRGPATMLNEPGPEAVVRQLPPVSVRPADRPCCPVHGSDQYANNGEWLCCQQERAEQGRPAIKGTMPRRSVPPPEIKAQMDAQRAEFERRNLVRREG